MKLAPPTKKAAKWLAPTGLFVVVVGCSGADAGGPAAGAGGVAAGGSLVGGQAVGGASATGGSASPGASGTGGSQTGASGGANDGGVGLGGGGLATAGAQTGGSATGGSAGQGGGGSTSCGPPKSDTRAIAFGTTLDAAAQVCESRALAQSLADSSAARWRAKGDQKRSYRFPAANANVPYRLVVPAEWDGSAELPLVMFLHGAGNDESSYLDQNDEQMVKLAQQHGYVLVSPLGYQGAYGNFLRLPAVFGEPEEAAKKIAAITPDSEATNQLSEKDVINVLELVLSEYPIDRKAMFLTGHSMGSGGAWYIVGKYADYWAALAPMSGPFVQETGYPWDALRRMSHFVTEGTQAESVAGSRALRDWMTTNGFKLEYKEVGANHPGMVPLVLPDVFDFFDGVRAP